MSRGVVDSGVSGPDVSAKGWSWASPVREDSGCEMELLHQTGALVDRELTVPEFVSLEEQKKEKFDPGVDLSSLSYSYRVTEEPKGGRSH